MSLRVSLWEETGSLRNETHLACFFESARKLFSSFRPIGLAHMMVSRFNSVVYQPMIPNHMMENTQCQRNHRAVYLKSSNNNMDHIQCHWTCYIFIYRIYIIRIIYSLKNQGLQDVTTRSIYTQKPPVDHQPSHHVSIQVFRPWVRWEIRTLAGHRHLRDIQIASPQGVNGGPTW